jgi:hypothetical protein
VSVVFILGAGASYGESLARIDRYPAAPGGPTPTVPPMATGFFKEALFESIGYRGTDAERDYPAAFEHIRNSRLLNGPVGTVDWATIDLEQIFTSIELERTFSNPESDRAAQATLVRNQLVLYVQRILSMCTQYCYGRYYRRLAAALDVDDSVLTFNWDLLLDQEMLQTPDGAITPKLQYNNFWVITSGANILSRGTPIISGTPGQQGLYLKMHGSFNWYSYSNLKCRYSTEMEMDIDTQLCLNRRMGIAIPNCPSCGSEMLPVLVPPLLHKPIADNGIIRAVWGLARHRLQVASTVVAIGFSAAPTDFYAAWLLRSTVGVRDGVAVFVVNPSNDPASAASGAFTARMSEIFPKGFNSSFTMFSQMDEVLAAVNRR